MTKFQRRTHVSLLNIKVDHKVPITNRLHCECVILRRHMQDVYCILALVVLFFGSGILWDVSETMELQIGSVV